MIAEQIGVICEPDVKEYTISQHDLFLLVGSASVFSYFEPEEIYNVLNTTDFKKVKEASEILQKKVKQAWK